MSRYSFEERPDFRRRPGQREFQIGVRDAERGLLGSAVVAKFRGPAELADAVRAAARAFCEEANKREEARS